MDYRLVVSRMIYFDGGGSFFMDEVDFTREVKGYLDTGWVLHGGVAIRKHPTDRRKNVFAQALIKNDKYLEG